VYDGDTFTCQFPWDDSTVESPIRIIGFNSEEIKDKSYSSLPAYSENPLETALIRWFG
jgi:hypothetical protein